MAAISNRLPEVTISYDTKKGRSNKHFKKAAEARTWFARMDKEGKNPKVEAGTLDTPVEAEPAPAPAPVAAPAVEAPKIKGVDPKVKSRPYYAGVVLANHGFAKGITKEMVDEVDKLYGEVNSRESNFSLRNAFAACRGLMDTTAMQKQT